MLVVKRSHNRLTQKEVEEKVRNAQNGEYILLSLYETNNKPILLKHNCGEIYQVSSAKSFFNEDGSKCPKCYPKYPKVKGPKIGKHTTETLREKIYKLHGDNFTFGEIVMGENLRSTKLIEGTCKTCNFKNVATATNWTASSKVKLKGCTNCAKIRRREHILEMTQIDDYLEHIESLNPEYKFLEEYKGSNKILHLTRHIPCNQTYMARPNDIQQGYGCPHCALKITDSKAVREITAILEKKGIEFERELRIEECRNIMMLPFDFAFTLVNGKTLLLEYDGSQHFEENISENGWTTRENFEKTQRNDNIKNEFCNDNNEKYELVRINYKQDHVLEISKLISKYKKLFNYIV